MMELETFERYQSGMARVQFFSLAGSLCLAYGLYSFLFGYSLIALVMVPGVLILRRCTPYFRLGIESWKTRTLHCEDEFVPLARWMVPKANSEITPNEYIHLKKPGYLSPLGAVKLDDVLQLYGRITVYDSINIQLLDEQVGKPSLLNSKEKLAKRRIYNS